MLNFSLILEPVSDRKQTTFVPTAEKFAFKAKVSMPHLRLYFCNRARKMPSGLLRAHLAREKGH